MKLSKIGYYEINFVDSAASNRMKTGSGAGESRLYLGQVSRFDEIYDFFSEDVSFYFFCKNDLLNYLRIAKEEYFKPTQEYREKKLFTKFYQENLKEIQVLEEDYLEFNFTRNYDASRCFIRLVEDEYSNANYEVMRKICIPKFTKLAFVKYVNRNNNAQYIKVMPIFSKPYTAQELGAILKKHYENSEQKNVEIHLFVYDYGKYIIEQNISLDTIIREAKLNDNEAGILHNALDVFKRLYEDNISVNASETIIMDDGEYEDIKNNIPSNLPLQQIYYGAPGTGKSHGVKEVTDSIAKEFVFRTTFHPDSDYSTFVGAYKPTMKQLPIFNQQTGAQIGVEDKIVYSFVPQAFLKAYVAAWKNQDQPVFLVIEEINRGNCAQIFGDIFQLLDRNDNGLSEYPIKADQDIRDHLAKEFADVEGLEDNIQSGEELILPSNLHIWATMNTSDQSLFPIDSAFKRRWDWKYMPIHDAGENWTIALSDMEYDWWNFVEKINKVIGDMTSSEDKKLGYFFCKACNGKIDAEKFVNKVVFYLWNDVFKDYELSNKAFDDVDGKLNFNKFYTPSGEANEETIIKFLGNLEVEISEYNHEGEDDDELEDNTSPVISQRRQKCKDFWTDFLEYTQNNSEYQKIFGGRKTPTPTHWYTYSVFNRPMTHLCVDQFRGRNELSIAIIMDKQSYIKLEESYKTEINQKLQDISLEWTRDLPKSTKKSSIKEVLSVTDFDGPQQQELFNHIIDRLLRMYSVFNEYLTKLPK